MKILYVVPSLEIGGAEILAVSQINALCQKGHDVHLLNLTGLESLVEQLEIPNENIHSLNSKRLNVLNAKFVLTSFSKYASLRDLLYRIRPDLAICHLPVSHFVMRLFNWRNSKAGYKLTTWNYHHSMQYEANPVDTLSKKIFHMLNGILCKFDYGNIFISKSVQENIGKYLKTKNNHLLPNAVVQITPDSTKSQRVISKLKSAGLETIFVVPGRLHPSKGHSFFINASLDFVIENRVGVIFCGGGVLEDSLKKQIDDLGLTDHYVITGIVSQKVLLGFLKSADVVIIPSINEGFGNVVLEANMVGKMVVAANSGGLKEVVRNWENGVLFNKLDKDDMIEKIKAMIDIGAENEITIDDFDFEKHINSLIQIIS